MIERTIPIAFHGRYVLGAPPAPGQPLLVGFHGYAEHAGVQLDRLRGTPGSDAWTLVSIQAPNRFYQPRSNDNVVAGWMTKQDRELAIADNLAYVSAVVDAVADGAGSDQPIVFAGFSQGVAMAFRAAVASPRRVSGVIAVGGDVPPELDAAALSRIRAALVCRGRKDNWYDGDVFAKDLQRLGDAGVDVQSVEFDGGHEWSEPVFAAAASFLGALR